MPRALGVIGPALLALLATAALLVPLAVYGGGVVANWDSGLSAVLNFAGSGPACASDSPFCCRPPPKPRKEHGDRRARRCGRPPRPRSSRWVWAYWYRPWSAHASGP
ncbi:hypothetical protein ACFV80_01660 [Streptomyces sp. NPDC059862]|uniref:hypothetical protein n=1 Tax=Streptomyces sp. NPDC059862 TaxID=3346975 RepID=UPI003664BA71